MDQSNVDFACSVLRKADTDSKKLAGLLLVGKLFAQNSLNESDNSKLLKAIDCEFLLRLLDDHYRQLTESSSEMENKDDRKAVDDELSTTSSFIFDIVLHFIPNIVKEFDHFELVTQVCGKILITHLTACHKDQKTIDVLIDCFHRFNQHLSLFNEEQIEILIETYMESIVPYFEENDSCRTTQMKSLLIEFILSLDQRQFELLLNKICMRFKSSDGLEKFKLCRTINLILESRRSEIAPQDAEWPAQIRDTLFVIFKNRLNDAMRTDAMMLSASMTLKFGGIDWIKCREREQRWNKDNSKFLLLLLRLVCIEVKLALESHAFDGDNATKCDANKMGIYLILFEHLIIGFIANLDDETVHDDEQRICVSNEEIKSTIDAITQTMETVLRFIIEIVRSHSAMPLTGDLLHLAVACTRLLCVYLHEESDALRERVMEAIPFIFDLLKQKHSDAEVAAIEPQVLSTMILLAEDDDAMKAVIVKRDPKIYSFPEIPVDTIKQQQQQ